MVSFLSFAFSPHCHSEAQTALPPHLWPNVCICVIGHSQTRSVSPTSVSVAAAATSLIRKIVVFSASIKKRKKNCFKMEPVSLCVCPCDGPTLSSSLERCVFFHVGGSRWEVLNSVRSKGLMSACCLSGWLTQHTHTHTNTQTRTAKAGSRGMNSSPCLCVFYINETELSACERGDCLSRPCSTSLTQLCKWSLWGFEASEDPLITVQL